MRLHGRPRDRDAVGLTPMGSVTGHGDSEAEEQVTSRIYHLNPCHWIREHAACSVVSVDCVCVCGCGGEVSV